MSRDKQIEEIYEVLVRDCDTSCMECHFDKFDLCVPMHKAEALYNAGYRKASKEGAECPTCYGTGRIWTTDWLTKNISKEQLAKEKAEAIAEHEAQLKQDVAREIFEEIKKHLVFNTYGIATISEKTFSDIQKKYESEGKDDV